MPFPPSDKSFEGLLKDTLERLTLVERRLAIGGTGGGETPYDAEAGMVMAFGGTTPPEGWLFCDGSLVSRTEFSALFSAIGTTYGAGDGSTTFGLPNYKGRTLVGRDPAQTEFDVLGETGGAKTHTLTIAEMPAHSHQWNAAGTNNPGGTPANWDDIVGANVSALGVGPANIDTVDNAIRTRGGSGAHNNLQPYAVANYIISTGKGVGGGGPARTSTGTTPYDALPGIVSPFAGGTIPTGWLLCDGQAVSRSTYSRLYAVIGTTYGAGDGSSTFNVPNLKGKVAVGLDGTQTEFDALGESGGAKTHTLTEPQIPAHNHGLRRSGNEAPNYGAQAGGGFADRMIVTGPTVDTYTDMRGGGQAHNNLQPYVVTNYIISTGGSVGGGGAVVGPDRTAVSAKAHGSSQSPGNGAWTIVSFTSEVFDTANMWSSSDPTKIIVPADGIYILNGGAGIVGNPAGRQAVQFKINGATVPSGGILDRAVDGTGDPSVNASTTASLKKGDYIQLEFYHDTGASKTFGGNGWAMPHLSVSLVGGLPGQLSTPDLTRGTSAQRDLTYGVPASAAQQAALANQVPEWFNTEKGYTEIYYAVTGTAGLTARGLRSGAAAGWYPAAGSPVFISVQRNASLSSTTAVIAIPFDSLWASQNFPFTLGGTQLVAPFAGDYEVSATAVAAQSAANYINLFVRKSGTTLKAQSGAVYPHAGGYSRADIVPLIARVDTGQYFDLAEQTSSSGTIEANTAMMTVKYLCPPLA